MFTRRELLIAALISPLISLQSPESPKTIPELVDWCVKYSNGADWQAVSRAMAVFEAAFKKKIEADGRVFLLAGKDVLPC